MDLKLVQYGAFTINASIELTVYVGEPDVVPNVAE